jgi:hypothetical protein
MERSLEIGDINRISCDKSAGNLHEERVDGETITLTLASTGRTTVIAASIGS